MLMSRCKGMPDRQCHCLCYLEDAKASSNNVDGNAVQCLLWQTGLHMQPCAWQLWDERSTAADTSSTWLSA